MNFNDLQNQFYGVIQTAVSTVMEQGHQHEEQKNFQGHEDSELGDVDLGGKENSEGEGDQKGEEEEPKETQQRQENNDIETENASEDVPAVNPPVHDFNNEENICEIIVEFMDGVLPKPKKIDMKGYPVYYNEVLVSSSEHNYIVRNPLGKGTYGHVVQCQNTTTGEDVAVKIVHTYYSESEKEISIIFSEHNVDLFNIIGVMEIFRYNNTFCFVSELLGVNLYEYWRQNSMPLKCIRPIIEQLLRALIFLKERGIVHGDIKPNNIMFVHPGTQSYRVKLIDFGCAFYENESLADNRLSILQHLHYRAPEIIIKARGEISAAIDMWSTGCVAAELFMNNYMFAGKSQYNQLDLMISMIGHPPKKMLDNGEDTRKYFYCPSESQETHNWVFKSIDEYNGENPNKQVRPTMYKFNWIKKIKEENLNKTQREEELAADRFDRAQFVYLLMRMLRMAPYIRISPKDALKHGFITMDNYNLHRETDYSLKSKQILDRTLAFYQTLGSSNENRHWRGSRVDLPENIWPTVVGSINLPLQIPAYQNQGYHYVLIIYPQLFVPVHAQPNLAHVLHLAQTAVASHQSVINKFDVSPSVNVAIVSDPLLDIKIVFHLHRTRFQADGKMWVPKSVIYPASQVREQIIPYADAQPLVTAWLTCTRP